MDLKQLSLRGVHLVSISIKWNVAAGDHHTATLPAQRVTGERGRRNRSHVRRLHSGVENCPFNRLGQFAAAIFFWNVGCGRRTQIISKENFAAPCDSSLTEWQALKILELSERIDVDLKLGEIGYKSSTTAGSELQILRFIFQEGAEIFVAVPGDSVRIHAPWQRAICSCMFSVCGCVDSEYQVSNVRLHP